jgi:hypothetical protein
MPVVSGSVRPLVLTAGHSRLSLEVGAKCSRLHLLGQVSCPDGYPIAGTLGQQAALFSVYYENGRRQDVAVRHEFELARGNCIYQSGRIEPIALHAQPAVMFVRNTAREHYRLPLFSVNVESSQVASIAFKLKQEEQPILLFAVGAEES